MTRWRFAGMLPGMRTKSAPARRSRPAPAKKAVRPLSASRQATEEARKGDPLPVRKPQDRSPKQENL